MPSKRSETDHCPRDQRRTANCTQNHIHFLPCLSARSILTPPFLSRRARRKPACSASEERRRRARGQCCGWWARGCWGGCSGGRRPSPPPSSPSPPSSASPSPRLPPPPPAQHSALVLTKASPSPLSSLLRSAWRLLCGVLAA
eukprot:3534654-Rhodomonas_salina.1